MRYLCLASLVFCVYPAWATKPPPSVPSQSQAQSATAESAASATSHSAATATGSGQATSSGTLTSSNDYSSRAIGLASTAPAPLHDTPPCYLPPKGIRRTRSVFFGLWQADPRLKRDDGCMADLAAAREFELARLRLEIERDREVSRRIEAESKRSGALAK